MKSDSSITIFYELDKIAMFRQLEQDEIKKLFPHYGSLSMFNHNMRIYIDKDNPNLTLRFTTDFTGKWFKGRWLHSSSEVKSQDELMEYMSDRSKVSYFIYVDVFNDLTGWSDKSEFIEKKEFK